MYLYLMRHGQAANKSVDPEQGLSAEGADAIEHLAGQLAEKDIHIQQAWHSGKKRARQTAEIITRICAPNVSPKLHNHIKPNDDPYVVLAELDDWSGDTLIASHLPYVPSLLALLTGNTGDTRAIDFHPGTIVCLKRNDDMSWQFEWVASP